MKSNRSGTSRQTERLLRKAPAAQGPAKLAFQAPNLRLIHHCDHFGPVDLSGTQALICIGAGASEIGLHLWSEIEDLSRGWAAHARLAADNENALQLAWHVQLA